MSTTLCLCVCALVCRADDAVHVSHSGSDDDQCGPTSRPCATLRFALSQHPNATDVMLDGTGGAYTTEAGEDYIPIRHKLIVAGMGSTAVIQCNGSSQHSRLFDFSSGSDGHRTKVSIVVSVSFCVGLTLSLYVRLHLCLSLSIGVGSGGGIGPPTFRTGG